MTVWGRTVTTVSDADSLGDQDTGLPLPSSWETSVPWWHSSCQMPAIPGSPLFWYLGAFDSRPFPVETLGYLLLLVSKP